jgi:hypothetical protein
MSLAGNAKCAIFAAVEIHNKPIFPYRYEVCTLLVINAWELALKAYIAKEMRSVNLVKGDGNSKPFLECVACVSSKLGKVFDLTKCNLKVLYAYRNRIAHLYEGDLDPVILGLLKASVLSFCDFLELHFGQRLYEEANLILLPIGFTKPVSPLDFISNRSAVRRCSAEVKSFLDLLKKSCEELQANGIDESVMINYSLSLVNESRIKNADLTAAISNSGPNETVIAIHNVISSAHLTNELSGRPVRLIEESIYSEIFTETKADVVRNARERFVDFLQNARFNGIMNELKKDPNLRRTRPANPRNPGGGGKDFYHKRIYDELAKHYRSSSLSSTQSTDLKAESVH